VAEEPVPTHRLNASLSGQIDAVIRKSLSKKMDARYNTCQEYVEALEAACAASKGWKTMPRGGSLNQPTVADVARPALKLPPPRRPNRAALDSSSTREIKTGRKSSFLTFLLAVLVAAGLIALIGWQSVPFLSSKATPQQKKVEPEAARQEAKPEPPPQPVAEAAPPAATPAPAPENSKPSPMPEVIEEKPPEKQAPAAEPAVRKSPPKAAQAPQAITIISSPGGATATIDGRASCRTPCSIDALPGRHALSVVLPGYQVEHREVDIGNSPVELPAVMMRAQSGTVMLTSSPSGASVLVNGKPIGRVTPTEISLPPGKYELTVEKDGRRATESVEVRTAITYLKILIEQ
jgi:outer membrane biosynthesis protein TonB